jgi:choline dehydrogenase-like flavoprotein
MDWGNHHLGTTRMSADPKNGVVDADCKVYAVANLFVAGSSVFPTYSANNPTLNLLAITLRLSDHLKQVMT